MRQLEVNTTSGHETIVSERYLLPVMRQLETTLLHFMRQLEINVYFHS